MEIYCRKIKQVDRELNVISKFRITFPFFFKSTMFSNFCHVLTVTFCQFHSKLKLFHVKSYSRSSTIKKTFFQGKIQDFMFFMRITFLQPRLNFKWKLGSGLDSVNIKQPD
jgi:hypothetical protein